MTICISYLLSNMKQNKIMKTETILSAYNIKNFDSEESINYLTGSTDKVFSSFMSLFSLKDILMLHFDG